MARSEPIREDGEGPRETEARPGPAGTPPEGARASPERGRTRPEGADARERGPLATRRAWVEIDLEAVRRNALRVAARAGGPRRLLPMVKADAYGLGAVPVARLLAREGVWGLGVATPAEGAELRRAGLGGRIVVFTPCAPLDAPELGRLGLEPAGTSLGALQALAERHAGDAPLPVHLEIDTGMGRFGLPATEAARWAPEVAGLLARGSLRLASTFTHFHSAESDPEATRAQWERFQEAVARLREAGVDPGPRHAANSAAALGTHDYAADLVRPGLYLYGGGSGDLPPEPAVALRAPVVDVREVPAGTTVSYGATFTTRRPSRLATLGIGYGDGLPHALSGRGAALVGGRRAPIVGTVCMDVTVVDVTGAGDVRPGDTATLLGADGGEEIALAEVAAAAGRIEYEVLTGLSRGLARVRTGDRSGPGAA